MVTTRSMNRNHNDDDDDKASTSKTMKTDDVGPWSNLNHDVLLLVMMQLGVIDFLAFSGVCKSWRSVALGNWKRFMASQPPMLMRISPRGNNDTECFLEDPEGRKFKTTLTHSAGMRSVGLSSGYLILFKKKTKDFWLVNPITRHEHSFPRAPCVPDTSVLVFSHSISRLVFVIFAKKQLWFSIVDEGAWNCLSTFGTDIVHLHIFKGRIYTISSSGHFGELTFKPEPKLSLLKTKNLLDKDLYFPELVSWGENLYVMEALLVGHSFKVFKLDFGKMEWVPLQDTGDEHAFAFFLGFLGHGTAAEPKSWADPLLQDGRFDVIDISGHGSFFTEDQWYFPHECLNVKSLR